VLSSEERSARIKEGLARTRRYQAHALEVNTLFKMFDLNHIATYETGQTRYPKFRFRIYEQLGAYLVHYFDRPGDMRAAANRIISEHQAKTNG
jgi:hypothetical protein